MYSLIGHIVFSLTWGLGIGTGLGLAGETFMRKGKGLPPVLHLPQSRNQTQTCTSPTLISDLVSPVEWNGKKLPSHQINYNIKEIGNVQYCHYTSLLLSVILLSTKLELNTVVWFYFLLICSLLLFVYIFRSCGEEEEEGGDEEGEGGGEGEEGGASIHVNILNTLKQELTLFAKQSSHFTYFIFGLEVLWYISFSIFCLHVLQKRKRRAMEALMVS